MKNKLYLYMGFFMAVFIALIIIVVFAGNSTKKSSVSGYEKAKEEAALRNNTLTETVSDESASKLTSDELDIWTLPSTGRNSSKDDTVEENAGDENAEDALSQDETFTEGTNTVMEKPVENIPSSSGLVASMYDENNFTRDGNILTYNIDGETASTFGLTISWKQGNVNMKRIKNSGCDFVYIYLGQRGYASGEITIDENFDKNLKGALSTSMKTGIIFKSEAINKDEILEEADVILTAITGQMISYPVVLEFETIDDDLKRTDALDKATYTDLCTYFINEMNENGFEVCLKADKDFFDNRLNLDEISDCSIWLNEEGSVPTYSGKINFWQYGSGIFNGVTNETSFSIHFNEE